MDYRNALWDRNISTWEFIKKVNSQALLQRDRTRNSERKVRETAGKLCFNNLDPCKHLRSALELKAGTHEHHPGSFLNSPNSIPYQLNQKPLGTRISYLLFFKLHRQFPSLTKIESQGLRVSLSQYNYHLGGNPEMFAFVLPGNLFKVGAQVEGGSEAGTGAPRTWALQCRDCLSILWALSKKSSIISYHTLLFLSWNLSLSIVTFLNAYYPPSQVKLNHGAGSGAQILSFTLTIVSVVTRVWDAVKHCGTCWLTENILI